jgi:hypothetical protein
MKIGVLVTDKRKNKIAELTGRQTLELMEEALGAEYPERLTSMNNLTRVLGDQGNYGRLSRCTSRR